MTALTPADRKIENSRLLREDLGRKATVFRGLPEVIAFHTTEKCNLRCIMCPRALGQGKLQLPRHRLAAICEAIYVFRKMLVNRDEHHLFFDLLGVIHCHAIEAWCSRIPISPKIAMEELGLIG